MREILWSRCAILILASLPFGIAPPASSAEEQFTGIGQPCLVMAGLDLLELVRTPETTPAPPRIQPVPGRGGPITKEEVGFLIHDLQRVPLKGGGWTIRAASDGAGRLQPERLRQLVGDVRSVLAVQHGRDVLAMLRRVPGVQPHQVQELEGTVDDIARCTFERVGGESAYQHVLKIIRDRAAELEAAVLEPFPPAAQGSR